MIVNAATLRTLGISFSGTFRDALNSALKSSTVNTIATIMPAGTEEQEYGWLGSLPRIREWIGDRQKNNLKAYSFKIKEKPWEGTVTVNRRKIETDNIGFYTPILQMLGQSAGTAYDELAWPLLGLGFSSLCYDGQYFFDTDHPVLDKNGAIASVANTDGGNGTPWYIVSTDLPVKPIIIQKGKDFEFVSQTDPQSDNVFNRNEFNYGCDAFHNAGFGLWQNVWGSKQTLDATHFNTGLAALQGMQGDYGRPFNFKTFKLIVPPSLRAAGAQIVNADKNADGSTNINFKVADLQVEGWLNA